MAIDLRTLLARVNGIETRLEKTRQVASAARPRAPVADETQVPEPPFRARRGAAGGARFLSITSTRRGLACGRPAAARGRCEGGWQLQSIEGRRRACSR